MLINVLSSRFYFKHILPILLLLTRGVQRFKSVELLSVV